MSPVKEQGKQAVGQGAEAIGGLGHVVGNPMQLATVRMDQEMMTQSRILAYIVVFGYCAIVAIMLIPFCFLLTPDKSEGNAGAH